MSSEQRKWPRRMLNTRIVFARVGGSEPPATCSGWVRHVSDGGLSFDTTSPLVEGALIDIRLKLYEDAAEQQVRGRVVRTRSTESGLVVGVKFLE